MKSEAFDFSTIHLLHEHLCLDFVNSTANHQNPDEEHFNSFADLVSWAQDVKLLNQDEAHQMAKVVSQQPDRAESLHHKALVLREALYRILRSAAHGNAPDETDLLALNTALTEATSHMRLAPSDSGYVWLWEGDGQNPEALLWRVIWSAGELLRSEALQNVRQCDGCDWLFIDTSRGHRRRWCDMNTCGNRAKARRHYRRSHEE